MSVLPAMVTIAILGPGMACQVAGQADTVHALREVEVTAVRISLTGAGKHSDDIDSQALTQMRYDNLALLLAGQTPLYVRSYGLGTLATLGIRGGSASHTQVMWNGIPLRNPMVGMTDLALIPSGMIDGATVHYGGHGAAFGSGAIGGLISFSNTPVPLRNGASVHISPGSWNRYLGELKLDYGFGRLRFSTRFLKLTADNNYRYRLRRDLPERNQAHHRLRSVNLLQEIAWRLSDRENLTFRLWHQYADRQIPPTSVQNESRANQQDKNLRASLHWSRTGDIWSWQVKTAWLNETTDYQDSSIQLYTANSFRTWLAEAETSARLGPLVRFAGGLYTEATGASSPNYKTPFTRIQHAAFGTVRLVQQSWLGRLQARKEITGGAWSPLLIDLSAEWTGIRNLGVKSSLSRNYRIPTLNDLYWQPGGNPGLAPEEGWTFEAGLYHVLRNESSGSAISLTGYTRVLDQWIMWMPPTKGVSNYWSPVNVAIVKSRGLEFRQNMWRRLGKWRIEADVGIDFTWSYFGKALPEFRIEAGNQVFYIPVENIARTLRLSRPTWSVWYADHRFGNSPGINEPVKAAHTASGGASFSFSFGSLNGQLYLQAENIWNVPYRLIERRPMPGRTFVGGMRFSVFETGKRMPVREHSGAQP